MSGGMKTNSLEGPRIEAGSSELQRFAERHIWIHFSQSHLSLTLSLQNLTIQLWLQPTKEYAQHQCLINVLKQELSAVRGCAIKTFSYFVNYSLKSHLFCYSSVRLTFVSILLFRSSPPANSFWFLAVDFSLSVLRSAIMPQVLFANFCIKRSSSFWPSFFGLNILQKY